MKRLPVLVLCVSAIALVLVAAPAPAAEVKGTFLVTQTFDLPSSVGILARASAEARPLHEIIHIDSNGEVRDLSGGLHENACGTVWTLGGGATITLRFGSSIGIGDWSGSDKHVSMTVIHFLYDCSGNSLGFAWVLRVGKAEVAPAPTPDTMFLPWPPRPGELRGWVGTTTVKFFDLEGKALVLPIDGLDVGVSELSGPFHALRVTGEPAR